MKKQTMHIVNHFIMRIKKIPLLISTKQYLLNVLLQI